MSLVYTHLYFLALIGYNSNCWEVMTPNIEIQTDHEEGFIICLSFPFLFGGIGSLPTRTGDKSFFIGQKELHMNDLTTEKTMTTKELAKALNVSNMAIKRVLDKTNNLNGTVKVENGKTTYFNEEQVTLIKQEIQKHHNLQSRQIDNVSTEMEIMLKIQEGYSLAVQKMKEYKIRAEKAESVVNRIADSTGLKTIQEVADVLGYGSKTFFAMLRGYGILYTTNGVNLPKREYINAGYFEVKEEPYERNGKTFLYSRIYVTSKGLLWLEKKTTKKE